MNAELPARRHGRPSMRAFAALLLAGLAASHPALAGNAGVATATVDKGDVAWMLTSTLLVLLMTVPGLALFYGGARSPYDSPRGHGGALGSLSTFAQRVEQNYSTY